MIENADTHPLITVITPSYNGPYLIDAIKSVLMQTYPKIEYIIADDASTNFPEEEIRQLLSQNSGNVVSWQILRKAQNVGTVKNLNSAIRVSHGEYIFLLAHDDLLYDEDVLAGRVKFFQETGALATIGLAEAVSFDLTQSFGILPPERKRKNILSMSPKELLDDSWFVGNICGCAAAYSSDFFIISGYFDEKYLLLEDAPTFYRLLSQNIHLYLWENFAVKYRLSPQDKKARYFTNFTYLKDRIFLIKDKLRYYEGIKKIVLMLELERVLLKCFLLHHNKKYALVLYYIETPFQFFISKR
jgi:glycosyltransferase involved in cell wall biosynthesis